jgi:hypothetical protein
MAEVELSTQIGKRITLAGHFDRPVTLEGVRALGADGSSGYECRVRLPDGTLDEAVISPSEAAEILATKPQSSKIYEPANAERLRLLIESTRFRGSQRLTNLPAETCGGATPDRLTFLSHIEL